MSTQPSPYAPPPGGAVPPPPYGTVVADPAAWGRPVPTDGWSIAGLVAAFVLAPVGLVLSIVGLVRTRDGQRGGRGLAIAGTAVSAAVMVLGLLLASIAIPTFLNQRQKGYDAQLRTDLRTTQTAMESYWVEAGQYPASLEELEAWSGPLVAATTTLVVVPVPGATPWDAGYCLQATDSRGGGAAHVSTSGSGVVEGACPAL